MNYRILNIIILCFCSIQSFTQSDIEQTDYFKSCNYFSTEQNDSAKQLLSKHENNWFCQSLLADIYISESDNLRALIICKNKKELNPAEACFKLARIYAKLGFQEEAMAYLEEYFTYKNPRSYSQILNYAEFENINTTSEWKSFWQTPRYSKTDELLEEVRYLISQNKNIEAIETLNVLNSTAKAYYKNYLYAKAYYNLNNYSAAKKYIQESLNQNSKYTNTISLNTELSIQQKDYSTAYNNCKQLLTLDMYNPDNLLLFAEICKLQNKYEEAKLYTNKYLKIYPSDEKALFLNTEISVLQKDYPLALEELSKILQTNTSKPLYFDLRGEIYYNYEMWNLAINDFTMSLDIDPQNPKTNYLMGMCKYYMASYDKACYYWRKAANEKNTQAAEMYYKLCDK